MPLLTTHDKKSPMIYSEQLKPLATRYDSESLEINPKNLALKTNITKSSIEDAESRSGI